MTPPPRRPLLTRPALVATAVAALLLAGCGGTESAESSSGTTGESVAASEPTPLGTRGPKAGGCFTYTDAETRTVETSVPCTVTHIAEVTQVLSLPDGLDPDTTAGEDRLDDIAAEKCPDAHGYVGYRGVLTGALYASWAAPTAQAQTEGARWLACTVAAYAPAATQKGDQVLQERDTPVKGALSTDSALLAAGTVCRPLPTAGRFIACDESKEGQWLALAYRDDPSPFVSAGHQEGYARSFCSAAATAYGKPDQEWHAFWSTSPTDNYGQHCLIPLQDFRATAKPVMFRQSQNKFSSQTEARFVAQMQAAGRRLTAEPDLMGEAALPRRTSRDYFPTQVQDRTLCAVLACTIGSTTSVSTAGNATTFTARVPFENQSCRGVVTFPLVYLGAPSSVEDIVCT